MDNYTFSITLSVPAALVMGFAGFVGQLAAAGVTCWLSKRLSKT